MSAPTIQEVAKDCHVDNFYKAITVNDKRYFCISRVIDDVFVMSATDGMDLWRLEMNNDQLEAERDILEMPSIKEYLLKIRTGLESEVVEINVIGVRLSLRLGTGTDALELELYEATAACKKTDFNHILFFLVDKVNEVEIKLKATNQKLEAAHSNSMNSGAAAFFDMNAGKKKATQKTRPKQPGMSLVNPGSKRRKNATGVEFD